MSRSLEKAREMAQQRNDALLIEAVEFGIVTAIGRAGAELTGFSVVYREEEVLLIVKGVLAGKKQVCFVASSTLADALRKVVREARQDKLRWRVDKWGGTED